MYVCFFLFSTHYNIFFLLSRKLKSSNRSLLRIIECTYQCILISIESHYRFALLFHPSMTQKHGVQGLKESTNIENLQGMKYNPKNEGNCREIGEKKRVILLFSRPDQFIWPQKQIGDGQTDFPPFARGKITFSPSYGKRFCFKETEAGEKNLGFLRKSGNYGGMKKIKNFTFHDLKCELPMEKANNFPRLKCFY